MHDSKIFRKLKVVVDDLAETLAEMEQEENPTAVQKEYVLTTADYISSLLKLVGKEADAHQPSAKAKEEKPAEVQRPVVPQIKEITPNHQPKKPESPIAHEELPEVEKIEINTTEPSAKAQENPAEEKQASLETVSEKPTQTTPPVQEVRPTETVINPPTIEEEKIPESIEELIARTRKSEPVQSPEKPVEVSPEPVAQTPKVEAQPEVEAPKKEVEPVRTSPTETKVQTQTDTATLNDRLSKQEDNSLLRRLQNKPVDLKSGISLADKLMFIKKLFNGESEAYNATIEQLNTKQSKAEAEAFMNNQVKPKYDWSKHQEQAQIFEEVLEKKFG